MKFEMVLERYSERFDNRLVHYLETKLTDENPSKFYEAVRHVPLIGGKRIRPILATLCCDALGGYPEDAMQWGLGVELVHNSSLIHDDIIDEDEKRRNVPTVHTKYGVPVAITVGDALLGEAFNILSTLPEFRMEHHGIDLVKELIVSIAIAAKDLYFGQALDLAYMKRFDVTVDEYMVMVEKKTASLHWLAARGGAILGGGNMEEIEALSNFGREFGVMFQIKDDLLGLIGDEKKLGKTVGIDITGRKRTLYMVHALQEAPQEEYREVLKHLLMGNPRPGDVRMAKMIFDHTGSIEYCKEMLERMRKESKSYLDILPNSDAKKVLLKMSDWAVTRDM